MRFNLLAKFSLTCLLLVTFCLQAAAPRVAHCNMMTDGAQGLPDHGLMLMAEMHHDGAANDSAPKHGEACCTTTCDCPDGACHYSSLPVTNPIHSTSSPLGERILAARPGQPFAPAQGLYRPPITA